MHMEVTNIVLNDLGVTINTMLVTTVLMNDTVQLKICQKYFPDSNVLYALYASAHVYMKMRVKVP